MIEDLALKTEAVVAGLVQKPLNRPSSRLAKLICMAGIKVICLPHPPSLSPNELPASDPGAIQQHLFDTVPAEIPSCNWKAVCLRSCDLSLDQRPAVTVMRPFQVYNDW